MKRVLIPVTKWSEFHAWPSASGLRNIIHRLDQNGFEHVLVRIGGRILIDEAAFFEWVESRSGGGCRNDKSLT